MKSLEMWVLCIEMWVLCIEMWVLCIEIWVLCIEMWVLCIEINHVPKSCEWMSQNSVWTLNLGQNLSQNPVHNILSLNLVYEVISTALQGVKQDVHFKCTVYTLYTVQDLDLINLYELSQCVKERGLVNLCTLVYMVS